MVAITKDSLLPKDGRPSHSSTTKPHSSARVSRPKKPSRKRLLCPSSTKTSRSSEDGPEDVFEFLAPSVQWSVSFLAVCAARNAIVSGSQALEFWKRGHGCTESSDLDIYVPWNKECLQDMFRVLNHAGIKWKNYIRSKLEELDTERIVGMPSAMILSLAFVLVKYSTSEQSPVTELRNYLDRLVSQPANCDLRNLFFDNFCNEVKRFCDILKEHSISLSWQVQYTPELASVEHDVWVFDNTENELHCFTHTVPDNIPRLVNLLYRQLRRRSGLHKAMKKLRTVLRYKTGHQVILKFGEDHGADTRHTQTIHKYSKINVPTLKESWRSQGLPLRLLSEYMTYTLADRDPYEHRSGTHALVKMVLQDPDEHHAGQKYGEEFRIMRGTMPSGKKIEMIIDPVNRVHPVYTVLRFYATNIMAVIAGTLSAHLFWSTAKNMISEKVDFRKDRRQKRANWAIENKYMPKGWTFVDMDRKNNCSRSFSDNHTSTKDFESLYIKALQEVGASTKLPKTIKQFFARKRNDFETLRWLQKKGKIPKKEIMGMSTDTTGGPEFLDWVHETLGDHDQVIPQEDWKNHNVVHTTLDIFFGGITSIGYY